MIPIQMLVLFLCCCSAARLTTAFPPQFNDVLDVDFITSHGFTSAWFLFLTLKGYLFAFVQIALHVAAILSRFSLGEDR